MAGRRRTTRSRAIDSRWRTPLLAVLSFRLSLKYASQLEPVERWPRIAVRRGRLFQFPANRRARGDLRRRRSGVYVLP